MLVCCNKYMVSSCAICLRTKWIWKAAFEMVIPSRQFLLLRDCQVDSSESREDVNTVYRQQIISEYPNPCTALKKPTKTTCTVFQIKMNELNHIRKQSSALKYTWFSTKELKQIWNEIDILHRMKSNCLTEPYSKSIHVLSHIWIRNNVLNHICILINVQDYCDYIPTDLSKHCYKPCRKYFKVQGPFKGLAS